MLVIHEIQAFDDNYIWAISNNNSVWIVDPGDALPVLKFLDMNRLHLTGILLTHWHADHQGGVEELLIKYPDTQVIGSKKHLKGPSQPVKNGEKISVLGAEFLVIEVPGHTLDHVAYFSSSSSFEMPVAFTGDTLFAAGCGRLFEGSPKNMFNSLNKINILPDNTRIYCAHEYTLSNLKFAVTVEPHNLDIQKRLREVTDLRKNRISTIPSVLKLERLTNLFLRSSSVEELALIRQRKDQF